MAEVTAEKPLPTINERVAAGVKLLDEYVPGWDKDIDLGVLELDHMEKCVIGQLFGDFCTIYYPHMGKGSRRMSPGLRRELVGMVWQFGFGAREKAADENEELEVEWERTILRKRRGK